MAPEELRSEIHRLEARLQSLETGNGLEAKQSLSMTADGNCKLDETSEEEKVKELALQDMELKVKDALSGEQTKPSEQDLDEQAGYVHFGESAWSFPLVIGLAPAGPWDVTFSILLLLLNLGILAATFHGTKLQISLDPRKLIDAFGSRSWGMQAAFSIIILDEDFMGIPFWRQEDFAKRWRTSMAHDYQYMDLAGRRFYGNGRKWYAFIRILSSESCQLSKKRFKN